MIDRQFDKLMVVSEADPINGRKRWLCECECGGTKVVVGRYLTSGGTRSCGCLRDTYDSTPGERICSKCKKKKQFPNEFAPRTGRYSGRYYKFCVECKRSIGKASIAKKPKWYAEKNKKAVRDIRTRNMLKIIDYLQEHPCVDCNEEDWMVLQFDHVRGNKIFSISQGVQKYKWNTIVAEIEKCEIRCANCHQRRTILENNCYEYLR